MRVETLDWMYRVAYSGYLTRGRGQIDREVAHRRMVGLMQIVHKYLPELNGVFDFESPILEYRHGRERYRNRLGLAAGLDKTGNLVEIMSQSGAAIGAFGGVTKNEYGGAQSPRIVADRQGRGMMNWMKFPNPGMEVMAKNLKTGAQKIDRNKFKIDVNTAVSQKSIESGTVAEDFCAVNEFFINQDVDIVEANFGHLATSGYQEIVASEAVFETVVDKMMEANSSSSQPKVTAVKLSMDLPVELILKYARLAIDRGIDQVNLGNTTRNPGILGQLDLYSPDQGGGYCGTLAYDVVWPKLVRLGRLCQEEDTTLVLSAGVDSAEKAVMAHVAGADLIQCLHGTILPPSGGPGFFYRMNKKVAEFCESIRIENVSELTGKQWVKGYLADYFGDKSFQPAGHFDFG